MRLRNPPKSYGQAEPSLPSDTKPHTVFAVQADIEREGTYSVWWRNYTSDVKCIFVDAVDELDAYSKGIQYLEGRREKKRRSKR